jgi:hypothetical protein
MTHTCPVCDKWVPKMHIKNHAESHKGGIKSPVLNFAFHNWLKKCKVVLCW